jgi:hypothetical protein
MTLELNEQEHSYLLSVLLARPAQEALPLILKLTGQKLVPASEPAPNIKAVS